MNNLLKLEKLRSKLQDLQNELCELKVDYDDAVSFFCEAENNLYYLDLAREDGEVEESDIDYAEDELRVAEETMENLEEDLRDLEKEIEDISNQIVELEELCESFE